MPVNKTSASKKKRYDTYKLTHKREKNKIIKLQKRLKEHPNDVHAQKTIERLEEIITKK